jgi:hypothetical protein
VFIDSIKIKRLATTKFLGTYINEHLDWKPHISHVALKMAKSIGIINKVKHFITSPTRRTLYCSLVLLYLQYCKIVWAKTYPTNLDKIMKLQKHVVRIIANAGYRDPTEPLFSKFKLLDVYAINKFQTGSFMYRCFDKSSIFPQHFRNYFMALTKIFTLMKRGMPTEFISTKSEQQQENKLLNTVDHCFGTL